MDQLELDKDFIDMAQTIIEQHLALRAAEAALTTLINRYGYEDDNETPKDWSEWVDARKALSIVKAVIYQSIGNA